jgi:hypothetical protein
MIRKTLQTVSFISSVGDTADTWTSRYVLFISFVCHYQMMLMASLGLQTLQSQRCVNFILQHATWILGNSAPDMEPCHSYVQI